MEKGDRETMDYMQERLKAMKKRLQDIDEILSKGEGDYKVLAQLSKERSSLATPVEMYESIQSMEKNIQEEKEMLKDPDLDIREMARLDILSLEEKIEKTKKDLQVELLPKDANDDKNVIMEIRGAAGGDEANIFAGDLFRMYEHYADKKGWKIKVLDSQMTALGGYSLVSFMVEGKGVYSRLKFESGAHRVQRVPVTEANGRIQTSTATVLVMPEIEKVDIEINPADLEIDTYHSSGAGGQDGVGCPHHPQADGDRRLLPGREKPDAEQGDGHGDAQGQAPEQIRIGAGGEGRKRAPSQGRNGREEREDKDLQLSPEPGDRPSNRLHDAQPSPLHGRGHGRSSRRPEGSRPDGQAAGGDKEAPAAGSVKPSAILRLYQEEGIPLADIRLVLPLFKTDLDHAEIDERDIPEEEVKKVLSRLLDGYPAAYLVGRIEILGIDLLLNEDVLIPRTETEDFLRAEIFRKKDP